jgi:hypothetical protein
MLYVERNSNGTRTVKFVRDWHPGRISKGYVPPLKNHVQSADAYRLQSMLLRNKK